MSFKMLGPTVLSPTGGNQSFLDFGLLTFLILRGVIYLKIYSRPEHVIYLCKDN